MKSPNNTPSTHELLLPVGQKEMALAAIHNGADAIYIGVPGFNARGRSYDFEWQELDEIIRTCHLYGVKTNLAFNIVIFEEEIPAVIATLEKILPLQPDALIVQDLGLAQIIRKLAPEQAIHASTQMTITNDLAMHLLDDLHIKRFVLGRENSLPEIKLIKEKTNKELEVFIHGALCVSYSGQCFTSETLGGRSANRGQCAQSCRFSYDLFVDGEKKNLLDREFLVSPKDLCGIQEIPELIDIGVTSFKVEGRLKTPEYVASSTREFRRVIDKSLQKLPFTPMEFETAKKNMATQYSRGFFSGWLHGVNHQNLVDGTYSSHRGFPIGIVLGFDAGDLLVELTNELPIVAGDGILWALGEKEWGSFVYSVEKVKNNILRIGIDKTTPQNQEVFNAKLYLNHDKELKSSLKKSYQDKNQFKKIPINIEIELILGKPVKAILTDGKYLLTETTTSSLTLAENKPLTDQHLKEEFSSLGGSVYHLNEIQIFRQNPEPLFISAKELKLLRQTLVQQLTELRQQNRIGAGVITSKFISEMIFQDLLTLQSPLTTPIPSKNDLKFNILLRNKDQVSALVNAIKEQVLDGQSFNAIIFDFEFGRDYKSSIEDLRQLNHHHQLQIKIGIATTRILKPQEYTNLKIISALEPDIVLIRNLGALYYFKNMANIKCQLMGDFSLNVTNHYTADYLLTKGLDSLCVSYDLNKNQVASLLKMTHAKKLEVTLHQYMPSFHMEHCVFAAFLSQGTSYKDCGKPCEKHFVQLKDQFSNYHWIKPDHECRNTMYNAKAQTALKFLSQWQELGLGAVRYEALNEEPSELVMNLKNYESYFKGHQDIESTLMALEANQSYGLSEGNLAREHKYISKKKFTSPTSF